MTATATAPKEPAKAVMPAAAAVTTADGPLVGVVTGVSENLVEVVMPVALPAGAGVLTPVGAGWLGVSAGVDGATGLEEADWLEVPAGAEGVAELEGATGALPVGLTGISVSVTGQTVTPMETVSVVTWPTGHSVTVGAQEEMV
jgi:hypothetical protein